MPKQKITRDELVAIATQVFRKKGYYNTTMNDIGTSCGLLKGSIYHYFQSKEDLMLEILRTGYREASENIFLLADNKDIPYRRRLAMMLEIPEAGMFANGTEDGGCLFGRIGLEIGSQFPVFNEVIQSHFTAYMRAFETIFLEAVDEGRAKELAKQAVVEMQGAVLLSIVYSNTGFYSEAKQRILSWVP